MRAVTWQGARDIRVENVPDPTIEEDTDIVIRVTSSGLCGSDLHLYEVLAPFMEPGDIVGHEPMGVVEAVGSAVHHLDVGDRVVVPFNVSCGHCWMCERNLQSQCETTQNTEHGTGATLLGYSKLYGQLPGGQAEYLRVPHADYGPVKVSKDRPDDRYLFLSDVLPPPGRPSSTPTCPTAATLLVVGAGPIGDMAARDRAAPRQAGHRRRPGRRAAAAGSRRAAPRRSTSTGLDDGLGEEVRDPGPQGAAPTRSSTRSGMEAHGSGGVKLAQRFVGHAARRLAEPLAKKPAWTGWPRCTAVDAVRRGGTISISGVYGGAVDPLPLMQLFDKQVQLRMGQANVRAWTDDILDLLDQEEDVLGVESFATHHLPLEEAPDAYETFQKKEDGAVKIVFRP